MKKIKYIGIAITLLSLGSCYKLDVAPYDTIAQGNFWKTEADAKSATMGVYAQLKNMGSFGYMPLLDTYSDIALGPGSPIEQGTYTATEAFLVANWKDTFDGVNRSNTVIKNVSAMSIDETVKANILGEARFLRALYYFHLVDFFGGVPIYDESWDVAERFGEMLLPRNSAEEVWNFIIADLTFAIDNLPLNWTADNYGRATKGAAYALRGKAHLYTKNWKSAIADFEEIVYNKTNPYNYSLYPNYSALFTTAGPIAGDRESIFSIQNKGTVGNLYGMELTTLYGTRGAFGGGRATCMPSVKLANMYEDKDGKPFNWNNYIPNFNEDDNVKKASFLATLNTTRQALATVPDTARLGNIYRNRDPRLTQSLIVPYSYYDGFIVGTGPKRQLYAIAAGTTVANGFIQNDRGWNVYFFRKFVPIGDMGGAITNRNHTPINFPIIRLADVLLMLSEAYN
ncbi:MAG: RagB/SusD family nutrient uptake outer membrane protein, partial [Pedobacter sp.]